MNDILSFDWLVTHCLLGIGVVVILGSLVYTACNVVIFRLLRWFDEEEE